MKEESAFAREALIAAIRTDCLRQAQRAQTKLNEAVECLGDNNHLGALGSFDRLDEDIACLKAFLMRLARIT